MSDVTPGKYYTRYLRACERTDELQACRVQSAAGRLRQLGRCCLVLLLLCDEQRLRHRVFLDSVERSSRSAAACRCGSFMYVLMDVRTFKRPCVMCAVCAVWLSLELWTTTVLRWSLFASLVNRVYLIEHSVELQHGPSVARHTCNTDTRAAESTDSKPLYGIRDTARRCAPT